MTKKTRLVSIHRAGVLAILAPGWGDWHAGRPMRGVLLFVSFFVLMAWGCWVLAECVVGYMTSLFEPQQRQWEYAPMLQLTISGVGMAWVWCLSLATAVAASMERYRLEGRAPDRAPWFGVLMSWCAPGVGHMYGERRSFGLALLALYLLSFVLLVPGVDQVIQSTQGFLNNMPPGAGANPLAMAPIIHDFASTVQLEMRLSPAWQFQAMLRAVAIADVCLLLSAPREAAPGDDLLLQPPASRPGWENSHAMKFVGYFGLGLLCPGAGQLLQGRSQWGWGFFALHYGLLILASMLLALGAAEATALDGVLSICALIRLVAAIEACWRFESPTAAPPAGD